MNKRKSSGRPTPKNGKNFAKAFDKSLRKVLAEMNEQIKPQSLPPPDPNRLKLVWRFWHLLPPDWSGETRVQLLRTPAPEIPRLRQQYAESARRLAAKRKFKRRPVPVSEAFWQAFNGQFNAQDEGTFAAACWWDWFIGQFHKVFAYTQQPDGTRRYDRLPFVEQQLSFRDFLMHNERDVATNRTTKELQITHPKFWELSAPALDLVQKARRRWEAYMTARLGAAEVISKLIVPRPLAAESLRRAAPRQLPADQKKFVNYLAGDFWKLSLYDQERYIRETFQPLRQPYEDLADHIACDAIAPDTLHSFMADGFLNLTLDQKLHFVRLSYQQRPKQKTNQYIILKTWLLDNAPVFQEFRWSLSAVFNRVAKCFTNYPGKIASADSQRVFQSALHDWGIVLDLPKGRSSKLHLMGRHAELLTKPAFFIFKKP
jgi:hypothetical protein